MAPSADFLKKMDRRFRDLNHRRIDFLRWLRLAILTFLFNQKNQHFKTQAQIASWHSGDGLSKPYKLLLLRLDGKIGDSITLSALMQELKSWPLCEVYLICRPGTEFIYSSYGWGQSEIKEAHQLKVITLKKNIFSLASLFWKLRCTSFDFLICTSHLLDPASLILSRFIKASQKIVLANSRIKYFDYHIYVDFYEQHVRERYRQILKLLQPEKSSLKLEYYFQIPEKFKNNAQISLNYFRQKQIRQFIVVNSFAGARLRNLSAATTKHLLVELLRSFPQHGIVSIANSGDLKILQEWKQNWLRQDLPKDIDLSRWHFFDEGDFYFNAALVEMADCVISPDTAIVHLASALKTKLVAIYREDTSAEKNAQIWAPHGGEYRLIVAPAMNPKEPDINSVSVQAVVQACASLIEQK